MLIVKHNTVVLAYYQMFVHNMHFVLTQDNLLILLVLNVSHVILLVVFVTSVVLKTFANNVKPDLNQAVMDQLVLLVISITVLNVKLITNVSLVKEL